MLKPSPLSHIRLVGLKSVEGDALKILQNSGALHITKTSGTLAPGKTLPDFEQVSMQLVRMRAIKNALPKPEGKNPIMPMAIERAVEEARALKLDEDVLALRNGRELAQKKIAEHAKIGAAAKRLVNLDVDIAALPQTLDYSIVSLKKEGAQGLVAKVEKEARHVQPLLAQDGAKEGNVIVLLAYPKGADLGDALSGAEMLEWKQPLSPRKAMARAKYEMQEFEEMLKNHEMGLEELSAMHYNRVSALEEALSIEADRCEIAGRFAESQECFHIDGWIRKADLAKLSEKMAAKLGGKVILQEAHDANGEGAHGKEGAHAIGQGMPTVLQNPKIASPFQYLVEMLSLPQPGEIDPTMFLALFLPIIYGMIVGDAGYAVISLLIAGAIYKIASPGGMLRNFAAMWALCALPAFVFGILFDEYFGFTHATLFGLAQPLYHPVVERVHNVSLLLLLSLCAGLVHIAIGFILGFINEYGHSKKHAIGKLAWLAVEIGGVLAVAGFMFNAIPPDLAMAGAGLLGLGALVIVIIDGPVGIFEIPSLASNIMSYARIAAVGVAGVILAEIINELLLPDPKMLSSPEGIAIFAVTGIAYVALHVFNTFVAMFESTIHGARLNVIEFYGKFYRGGGIRFVPFEAKRKYTVAEE